MADQFSKTKAPVAVLEYEPSGFEQTLIKHKSKLILVGVLAVAGTVGYWGWRLAGEASNKSAAVASTRATTVQELKEVAGKHAGKPAAGTALVDAAQKLSAERPGEAIGILKDFLAKYDKHPLRDLASFRIGEYYVASGDMANAEKEYDAAAKAGGPFSAFALLRLGDIKWGAGDTEKAREYYDMILRNGAMSGSPARTQAQSRLDRALKVKAPALVEFTPDAPPAAPGAAPGLNVQGLGDFGPGGSPSDSLLPPLGFPPPVPQPVTPPVVPVPAPEAIAPSAESPGAPPVEAPKEVPPAPPAENKDGGKKPGTQ